ncbi:hypothetical protein M1M07_30205, partial [Rhodococcus sp. HM1]|nr:hypothetical protein [Rhodococcus sp. HM1]
MSSTVPLVGTGVAAGAVAGRAALPPGTYEHDTVGASGTGGGGSGAPAGIVRAGAGAGAGI